MNYIKFIFLIFLTSCVSIDDILYDEKVFFLSGYENVKIIEQDSNISGSNIHPVSIEPERIEGCISTIYYKIGTKQFLYFLARKLTLFQSQYQGL